MGSAEIGEVGIQILDKQPTTARYIRLVTVHVFMPINKF